MTAGKLLRLLRVNECFIVKDELLLKAWIDLCYINLNNIT